MDIADRPKPFEIADSLLEMAQDVEIGHADRLGVPAASFLRECADCISRQADEIERLRGLLTRVVAWEGAVDVACPELGGLLKVMYEARDALDGK